MRSEVTPTTRFKAGDFLESATASASGISLTLDRHVKPLAVPAAYENAVYAYIRALRALGKTQVNTNDIAVALGISLADVTLAVARLGDKGVKRVK